MKKLSNILITVALLMASACEEFLEQPEPAQSLPSSEAFGTVKDLQTALIGAYDAGQDSDFFGTNTTMTPDIIADNGAWRGSFPSYQDISNINVTADNAEIEGMWESGYRVINQANLILAAVDELDDPELTPQIRDQLRGESFFLRGASLFEMVRFFSKPFGPNAGSDMGIPIVLDPVQTTDDVTFPSRNSVAEVYNQAIADLQAAADILPDFIERGRANRYAAIAYLAEISFQQRDYNKAANLAETVINGPFALTAEPVDFFVNEGSSEEIWAYIHTTQDNPGVNGSLPTFHHVNGRGGDVIVSDDLKENGYDKIVTPDQRSEIQAAGYTVEDLRFTQLTSMQPGDTVTINIEKYEDFANNSDDAPIHRLAEFILMRAEALVQANGLNQESIDLLNMIRQRALRVKDAEGNVAGNSDSFISFEMADFASAEELIETIILERRVELTFEGNRFHDLMRLQRPIKGFDFDADLLRWPLPQRELDANANLVQNPGY